MSSEEVVPRESESRIPEVSIVVPTYNRMDTLEEVLEAILEFDLIEGQELVVVNDGSEPATKGFLDAWCTRVSAESGRARERQCSVQVLHQENQGPAAARNHGVRAASGRLVAFLGDDTVPSSGWLRHHLDAHRTGAKSGVDPDLLGVIGYTGWHPRMRLNPFLRYINDFGLQFGYALIDDPANVPFNFFYTSNLSLPRQLLLEEPFDVDFPYAAWEDIEVSYRLEQRQFRLMYAENAVVQHDHPTDLLRFGQRQEKAGFCAVVFFQKHRELGDFLGVGEGGPPPPPEKERFQRIWWLVRSLQRLMETRVWSWLPTRWFGTAPKPLTKLWEEALRYHYILGLNRGWRERVEEPEESQVQGTRT